MDADRQAMTLRGRVNGPPVPAPERAFPARGQQQDSCTNRRSLAQRSISSTASSIFCVGTTIEARRRGSRSSHSLAAIQNIERTRAKAPAMSSLNRSSRPHRGSCRIARRACQRSKTCLVSCPKVASGATSRPRRLQAARADRSSAPDSCWSQARGFHARLRCCASALRERVAAPPSWGPSDGHRSRWREARWTIGVPQSKAPRRGPGRVSIHSGALSISGKRSPLYLFSTGKPASTPDQPRAVFT